MTQPNPLNYALAAEIVGSGQWRVDAALGLVYGKKGLPFRRTNSAGYIQIKFRDPDDWRAHHSALAHRVVWESVHGPLAAGLTINHLNGIKSDNRLDNLEAITMAANIQHAIRTGLWVARKGELASGSRLTDEQVREIYRRAWQGERQSAIGSDFGVGQGVVSNIKCGWAWNHVTCHRAA